MIIEYKMKTIWRSVFLSVLLLLFVFFFWLGMYVKGKSFEKNANRRTMNDYGLNMDSLKWCIISKGDKKAYENFCIQSMSDKYDKDAVLLYALIMSNKFNYAPANVDIYLSIINKFENINSAGGIDAETLNLALHYLKKGASMKEYNALSKLSWLYFNGKYIPKDTIKAQELEKEAKKVADF
jgi:hypothetical protein